ncbi:MAG: hypothetical protein IKU55_04790, partial [Clostridia bacterium]|nr:hypothetical protein [Clostridia bacterium]
AVTESETRAANGAAFAAELEARGVAFLDMYAVFAQNGGCEPYYMRTDHHYNLKGAELVYRTICETLFDSGVAISAAELNFTELDLKLLGSRNRAIYYLSDLRDTVYLAEPTEPVAFTRTDNGKEVATEVFRRDLIDNDTVTYSLYMGGDIGETVIATDREDLPDVLLFGDSYTNAVETLLYLSCDELRTLDLRHYKEMTLTEYVERYQPDVVICLRDDNNYLVDTGNGKLR